MNLWVKRDCWSRVDIPNQARLVDGDVAEVAFGDGPGSAAACVVAFVENGVQRAALITSAASGVFLNGYRPLGVAVLEDHDEIAAGSERFYFAARSPSEVMPFPQSATETRCARCKQPLHVGDLAVRCAACSGWHHEGPLAGAPDQLRECWTYDPACGACGRQRETLLWTPEEEDDD